MNDSELVTAARRIALHAHEGQTDKAGNPYWLHPQAVARRVQELYPQAGPESVAATWLHDVIEDTKLSEDNRWTADDLREAGFPDVVVDAVQLLTRDGAEGYHERIRADAGIALKVKHADIRDNLDEERLAKLDPEVAEGFRAKYAAALEALGLDNEELPKA